MQFCDANAQIFWLLCEKIDCFADPNNWKDLAIAGAARVRKTFEEENISVVIAADETFLRFHESSSKVL